MVEKLDNFLSCWNLWFLFGSWRSSKKHSKV